MSTSGEKRSYSVLDEMQSRLYELAYQRIRTLSKEDLKSVMVFLEYQQLVWSEEAATTDEPVRGAKERGKVELCVDLANEMFTIIEEQIKAEKQAKEEVNA